MHPVFDEFLILYTSTQPLRRLGRASRLPSVSSVIPRTHELVLTSVSRRHPPQSMDDPGSLVWLHGEYGEPPLFFEEKARLSVVSDFGITYICTPFHLVIR